MKRSITKNQQLRIEAQVEEAKLQKLGSVAEGLTSVLEEVPVRSDDAHYVYANDDMRADVNRSLWNAVVRIADYLGSVPDAEAVQPLLDKYADELVREICVIAHVPDGVGAYEPTVPGELRQKIAIEVEVVDLKDYREEADSSKVENLLQRALDKHPGEDLDVSYNNQHYGWFVWDSKQNRHEQQDLNDFDGNDNLSKVRNFVSDLKKIKLEDYE